MTAKLVELPKKEPELSLSNWLRQYADQIEKEEHKGVARAVLVVFHEDGDDSLQRHWKFNASLIEAVGMLACASFDRLNASCKD